MANIGDVYGNNFQQQALNDKASYVTKLLANNIAHLQFSFRNENGAIFDGNNIKQPLLHILTDQVRASNPNLRLLHVNKTSSAINRFPYLINGAAEYFNLVDLTKGMIYSIYITPDSMEAY